MFRTAAVMGALALLMTSVDLFAQTCLDLSGSWTAQAPAGGAPAAAPGGAAGGGRAGGGGAGGAGRGGGMGGMMGLGQAATITQTATQLTIVRTVMDQQVRSVYNLDGSESRNSLNMGGQAIEQVSRAAWDGNKLVIRTQGMGMPGGGGGGAGGETVMALSLNAQGQLVLETTAPGRGGGDPTTTTQVYTK